MDSVSISVSFSTPLKLWSRPLKSHISSSLLSSSEESFTNIVFICADNEKITWNALAYLATLSKLFQARSSEEQHFTVHLPDYGAGLVRKLLLLLSTGVSFVRANEVDTLARLAKDLGVSLINFNF